MAILATKYIYNKHVTEEKTLNLAINPDYQP